MTEAKLRSAVLENGNGFYFTFNGMASGVEPEVIDSVFTFEAWHGNLVKRYKTFDEVVNDKFYSGYSINNLLRMGINFSFC